MQRDAYYSDKFLAARYGVRRQTLWEWSKRGLFPQSYKLAPQTVRWYGADVLDHEAKLADAA